MNTSAVDDNIMHLAVKLAAQKEEVKKLDELISSVNNQMSLMRKNGINVDVEVYQVTTVGSRVQDFVTTRCNIKL